MNIRINSVQFMADQKLESFIHGKIAKLTHYYEEIIGAEVFLRLGNTQDLANKITEIKLEVPGNDLFAKKMSKSFEESTDQAIEALKKQISKKKTKAKLI